MTDFIVSAQHVSPDWAMTEKRVATRGTPGNFSCNLPGFGYVCGHASPEAAIRDLLRANGCTGITITPADPDPAERESIPLADAAPAPGATLARHVERARARDAAPGPLPGELEAIEEGLAPAYPARETIEGPGGLRLELDAAEIFPDDPGAGTPAMVHLGRHSATFHCALDTGELDCGERQLSAAQCRWLESMDDRVAAFLEAN